MAKCAYCGTTVIFGGKKLDGLTFCDQKCQSNGEVLLVARQLPDDLVVDETRRIHAGPCPVCKQQRGAVDVHTSYKVHSVLIYTSWSSTPRISCRPCGLKGQAGALSYSIFLGWWGLPWGLVMTPVQVVRNIHGMVSSKETGTPSEQLGTLVRRSIALQAIEYQNARKGA